MRRFLALLLLVPALAGCLSDSEDNSDPSSGSSVDIIPGPVGPFNAFGEVISESMAAPGNGIWIHEGILYWTDGHALIIFDVSDASNPVQLSSISELVSEEGDAYAINARDVDILELDGVTYAVLAGSGQGIHLVDVTDPTAPTHVGTASPVNAGAHNVASVPGTPYVYVAGGAGLPVSGSVAGGDLAPATLYVDVADFTDPAAPVVTSFPIPQSLGGVPVTSDGCHDITVRADLGRAYCGGAGGKYLMGGGESFIWDISDDPTNPVWVSMVDDPRIIYHHQAFVNSDGTKLIVNDEYVGLWPYTNIALGNVAQPGANNCLAYDSPAPGPLSSEDQFPAAAAWIYDITDESAPVLVSHIQNDFGWDGEGAPPNPAEGNCGSHFGDILPDQDVFVMGWYDGGTIMVDFSDAANPTVIDRVDAANGETWDARYWNGHVFHASGDLLITPLVPESAAPADDEGMA